MADAMIVMGSGSDLEKVKVCGEILEKLGISFEFAICSAHRTPDRVEKIIGEAADTKVFICAAGMAAHLAGAFAARTLCPVIGIPISSSTLGGMDALLSTVQMPSGVPVATMALDKAGAKNAAWLAAEIMALSDPSLKQRLEDERKKMREEVERASISI